MSRRKTVHITGIKGTGSACGEEVRAAIIMRAPRWKYCRVCENLQPLDHFDRHGRMPSGHQLECRSCKKEINRALNPLRTVDQHRESAERRRLYGIIAGETKINSGPVYEKSAYTCFRCGKALNESAEKHLAHTLPAKLFWPLSTGPTLLCSDCNNVKHDKWPSEVYTRPQLKKLSVLTGIAFNLLGGPPKVNPEAVERIIKQVDNFVETWIPLPEDIKRVRKTILEYDGRDIFDFAKHVPPFLLEEESQPQR